MDMESLQRNIISADRFGSTINPSQAGGKRLSFEDQIAELGLDYRTARMLAIFMNEGFKSKRSLQRSRFKLVSWVIRSKFQAHVKRAFDLLIAFVSLPLFSPLMLITAIAIKLDSPGPVIFRQERVGKWGRPFACYKFRSMYVDAEARKQELLAQNEADEIVFKIRKDPRVTRVGRIIRKLSFDELPQIFNVIKGDMSIVGPRPPIPYEVARYEYDIFYRLDALPGITGLQQVSGRSDVTFKRWIELDLQYIQEQSLWTDIKIMLKTIPAVISGKGAY
jgi:exopolysaccharide biosynthesis polyprenyl glycosylphosphotransferase